MPPGGRIVMATDTWDTLDNMVMVIREVRRAEASWPPFRSYHEGYAIILEELDELWEEIKGQQSYAGLYVEATQVAAMALRFMKLVKENEKNKVK